VSAGRAVFVALLASACQGPRVESVASVEPASEPPPSPAPVLSRPEGLVLPEAGLHFGSLFTGGEGDTVLARSGGLEVRKHHVFDRLHESDPELVREHVELLLLDVRVRAVAEELGVEVPESDLRLAVRREWARVERAFAQRPAGAATVEDYVRDNYAMTRAEFEGRVRMLQWRRLLRSYAVRYHLRQRGRVRLQYFASTDRTVVETCHARVAAGGDFAELARAHSRDRSASNGGRLPDLPLDFDHPAVRLAGDAAAGTLGPVTGLPEGGGFAFVRVIERSPPDRRPFPDQVALIRQDLERRPVQPEELAIFVQGR
jgi:hypothetical protein